MQFHSKSTARSAVFFEKLSAHGQPDKDAVEKVEGH